MDGNWQICTHTAEEYGRKALETAKMMKWLDPSIELIACGSSGWLMPSCPEWDRKVLEYTYDYVDYISLHRYYQCDEKTNPARLTDYLCSGNDMDVYIKAIISAADYVKAVKRGKRTLCSLSTNTTSFPLRNFIRRENYGKWGRRVRRAFTITATLWYSLLC